MTARIILTDAARRLIESLKDKHGPLIFHQSGGCCDGSQPMCFKEGEFKLGASDLCLGEVAGCPFWMSRDQFEYLKHMQLCLDVVKGRGSSFSLEIPLGYRFIIRSRLFKPDELANLHTSKV